MGLPYLPPLVVLALYFWGFLDHAWSVVTFPYQLDYGEMPELNRAWLLAQGRQIYVDWSRPPYQMANYPPLYSAAAAAGVAFFGEQFFTGRLLSLASTLAGGACLAAIAASLGTGRWGALVGGLLYFVGHPVWNWGAFQRVDAFAVALELLGVAVFSLGVAADGGGPPGARARGRWAVWATVPLFLAAAYARQTVVAGAFACYAYLLVRRPRLALAAIAAYGASGLAALGLLQLQTEGQFWRHIVDGNLNRWSWETVDFYWRPFWRLLHWSFPLAAGAALAGALTRAPQFPLLYLVASGATALTIGKIGSNVNYLLQLWAGLSLMTSLAVSASLRLASRPVSGRRPVRLRVLAHAWGALARPLRAVPLLVTAIWLLVGLQQAFHVPFTWAAGTEAAGARLGGPAQLFARLRWTRLPLWRLDPWAAPPAELPAYYRRPYRENPSATDRETAARAHEYMARLPEDVLGEEMSFTVTTGKRIYLQPFEFTQLAEQGEWDQRPLLDDIRRGSFTAVVLRFRLGDDPGWRRQRIGQPMIDALAGAYELAAVYGDYFIYRPKAAPSAGSPPSRGVVAALP